MAIPYLDSLIANINSCFSGVVVELVSLPQYFTQLFFLIMRHFSKHMVILSYQPWLTSMGKRTEVTFDEVTYSPLAIINKEELLGEWQVFTRAVFHEKKFM